MGRGMPKIIEVDQTKMLLFLKKFETSVQYLSFPLKGICIILL